MVLFDFGGTLDADGVHWSPRLHAAYRAEGGSLEYASFERLVQAADRALARLPEIRGLGFRDTIEAEVRLLLELVPDRPRVDAHRMSELFYGEARAAVARNRPVLERLARRYRLGIVSNFYGNLTRVCDDAGIRSFFDVLVDSAEVGWTKPDPRIFQRALGTLGVSASAATFIGDSLPRDMAGARAVGMRHIWLAGAEPSADGPCCRGDRQIRSLRELEAILL